VTINVKVDTEEDVGCTEEVKEVCYFLPRVCVCVFFNISPSFTVQTCGLAFNAYVFKVTLLTEYVF